MHIYVNVSSSLPLVKYVNIRRETMSRNGRIPSLDIVFIVTSQLDVE